MDFLKRVLKMFTDDARMQKRGFFTTFFKTTEEDYTNAEFVEIDIERSGNKVAPVLKDHRTGGVIVDDDIFTEKRFKPPYSCLKQPVPLMDLMQRQPGERDDDATIGSWFARLVAKIKKALSKFHRMFKEQIELQCAQIMQTGIVQLSDENGNIVYDLDFKMKSSQQFLLPGVLQMLPLLRIWKHFVRLLTTTEKVTLLLQFLDAMLGTMHLKTQTSKTLLKKTA